MRDAYFNRRETERLRSVDEARRPSSSARDEERKRALASRTQRLRAGSDRSAMERNVFERAHRSFVCYSALQTRKKRWPFDEAGAVIEGESGQSIAEKNLRKRLFFVLTFVRKQAFVPAHDAIPSSRLAELKLVLESEGR